MEERFPAAYIAYDRIKTSKEKERRDRLLLKFNAKKESWMKEDEIRNKMLKENWYSRDRKTGQRRQGYPNIILTTFDWEDERNDPNGEAAYQAFIPGRFAFADYRDKVQLRQEKGVSCNSGYEIHSAFGCLHACTYCHVGNALTIMLDIETLIGKLGALMENNLRQKLFKYDNQTDTLALEPEYGASKAMVEFFAETDRMLLLYTKSDNIDHLLNLDHKGHTKISWTMSCEEVASEYELEAPTLEERIEAAKKCQDAGYGIRFRFSPIIPIKGWRENNSEMIAKLLSQTRPEVIALESLCHMTREQYTAIAQGLEFQPHDKITEYELFSHEDRKIMYEHMIKEIRKHDKQVKIALCLETGRMWQDLGKLLKGKADNFYCVCGSQCA